MDSLIFYSKTDSFKSIVEKLTFSLVRPYSLYFPTNYDQIGNILSKKKNALLFYATDELSIDERMRLRLININFKNVHICLISLESQALEAWKLDLFHFEEIPLKTERLLHVYKKYIYTIAPAVNELILKNNEEIIKISYDNITHLIASGNYTMIYTLDGKSMIQTRQLGMFDFLTEKDLNFQRMHRSLIVNIRNISSIGNGKIVFKGSLNEMIVSANLETKMKRVLMGLV